MLRLTSYWPGLPAGGFRGHGVYSLEPAVAVAHDPVGTGLRLVTAQPSGLTHVYCRQSLCSDKLTNLGSVEGRFHSSERSHYDRRVGRGQGDIAF